MTTSFYNAEQEYRDALSVWIGSMDNIGIYRAQVSEDSVRLDDIKAEVIANGGTAEVAIDGKNAEQRKAQLELALAGHTGYQVARSNHESAKGRLADAEARRDEAAHTLALTKRLMDFAIAEAHLRAATLGNNGTEQAEPALSR